MKDSNSRLGCDPASHGTPRRGEEGGAVVRRLPDLGDEPLLRYLLPHERIPGRVVHRDPIRWWRHHLARDYDELTVRRMRRKLAKFDLPTHHLWPDAAAAIRIAFELHKTNPSSLDFNLAMTALAVCAAGGNYAACVVLAKVLRSLPDAGSAERHIADSWIELSRPEVKNG